MRSVIEQQEGEELCPYPPVLNAETGAACAGAADPGDVHQFAPQPETQLMRPLLHLSPPWGVVALSQGCQLQNLY